MTTAPNAELGTIYVPLRLTYGLVPIVAGMDKFLHLLADWGTYLPPGLADSLPMAPTAFMQLVGVIEIVAGLAVLVGFTRLGAYVVMAWLVLIAATIAAGGYFDIAVRDLVMAVGAYALGRTAALRGEQWIPGGTGMEGRTHAPAK